MVATAHVPDRGARSVPGRATAGALERPAHEAAISGAGYTRRRRTHRGRGHDRPRVLQLLATGGTGGAQESYTGLLLRLDRTRYDVRAVSLSSGAAVRRLRRLGIGVEVVPDEDDDAAVEALTEYLVREEIDLLHAHMYRAEVAGTLAAIAGGTPVVVATVHSSRVRRAEDVQRLARLTPHMSHLIVPSRSIAAKVRQEGRGGAPFSIVPNGIDLDRFTVDHRGEAFRAGLGIARDAVLIGVVARLAPEKGVVHLLDAMPAVIAAAPTCWLVVVGDGPCADGLRAHAAALPYPARDRVRFVGRRDDVSAITSELDVAVLPSLREAQGISLVEAMARGRPVVASRVGGIPEVVTDGENGLLVPPADPRALSDALVRLAQSRRLRRRLGSAGRQTVEARFSLDAMVRRVEEIYDGELARAGITRSGPSLRAAVGARSDHAPQDRGARELPPL